MHIPSIEEVNGMENENALKLLVLFFLIQKLLISEQMF